MKIMSLTIQAGLFKKEFSFSQKINLVHSNVNSVGKTSLLRMILFAMGYPVPSTKGLKFEKYRYKIKIADEKNNMFIIKRFTNYCILQQGMEETTFSLPTEFIKLQQILFGISNESILDNILGVIYADQEKGWTLLNRGKVIGSISFNIERFLQGLSDNSCDELYKNLDAVNRQISKYKHMMNIAEYQKSLNELGENIAFDETNEDVENKILVFEFEKKPLAEELKRLKNVFHKNISFKKYITQMQLYVEGPEGRIPVNETTLCGFKDNNEYLSARINIIASQISEIEKKIDTLQKKVEKEATFVAIETLIDNFDSNISKININQVAVENVLKKLMKERKHINDAIINATKANDNLINEMHKIISNYALELGVDTTYVSANKDYIFTHDLQSLSGAILHKIVFSFRLAYIQLLRERTGCIVPIILDSPSGREVDSDNVNDMMKIVERDFAEHQIIVASIYRYEFMEVNNIELEGQLLDF